MRFAARSALEEELVAAPPLVAARMLVHLGQFDAAAERLEPLDPATPAVRLELAIVAEARGDPLAALHHLDSPDGDPERRRCRARVLAGLGRIDEAFAAIEALADPASALARSSIHLAAGESQPARAELPEESAYLSALEPGSRAAELVGRAAFPLVAGEIELGAGGTGARAALEHFRRARDLAHQSGAATQSAQAWSGIGVSHARLGNRWRALRAVTHGLDLARAGRVAAPRIASVHVRAWEVYRAFDHGDLAEQAIQAGHHRIIQIATSIDVRDYRESFFLDNRDNQRLVAAWKGEASWGADIPRG